jgi:hypothetical protein
MRSRLSGKDERADMSEDQRRESFLERKLRHGKGRKAD